MPHDSSRQAGAHQSGEIEITEAMIDAGLEAALPWMEEEWFSLHHRRLLRDAFLAMRKLENSNPCERA